MAGFIALLYGVVCYCVFLGSFLYAIAFVGNVGGVFEIPKTIDSGPVGATLPSIIIDLAVLSVFAIQHSVMARPAFKRVWVRIVPHSVERSTYVLASSLALLLIYWQWRPLTDPVWTVTNSMAVTILMILFWAGWGIVLVSTFLLNHFDLFGLRQVWARVRGKEMVVIEFQTPLFYKVVRHPIYLGFIIAFWATPAMSSGHLLFAAVTTAYIFVGIFFEERDLINHFGEAYVVYRRRVSMIFPRRPAD